MRRERTTALLLTACVLPASAQHVIDPFAGDFEVAWTFVDETYAYFEDKQTDWIRVREHYAPRAEAAADSIAFIHVLEDMLGELYDDHVSLDVNAPGSPRPVPMAADLWAEWRDEDAVITAVRDASEAERVALRPGLVVVSVDDVPIRDVALGRMPKMLREPDPAAWEWALRSVLAGHYGEPVRLAVREGGDVTNVTFIPGTVDRPATRVTADRLSGDVGHIRFHDALVNADDVAAFDEALDRVRTTPALILDLRDTPSRGERDVALGVLSRFVPEEGPCFRHTRAAGPAASFVEHVWVDYVVPRGTYTYVSRLVVLVGRWTGPVGQSIAMALDGMGRGTIVGVPPAPLHGVLVERALPNTGIVIRVPGQRLYHLDGSPQEAFEPAIPVPEGEGFRGRDPELQAALDAFTAP